LVGLPLSNINHYCARMNSARWFQRREDYQPKTTPAASPFRHFLVRCLKCGSYRLRVIAERSEDSGEAGVFLYCPNCHQREQLPLL
jgi:Zn finger protein HypA/HybF involved in hydrogenase expression